ncbi:MAG: dienelactone hydrolase family protein [Trueperaceae bacterium]
MILLRRSLLALAFALVAVVVGVAVSIPFDGWLNRDRVAALTNAVADGATPVAVYLARPAVEDGPLPVVVMIHEFWGLNEALLSKADLLAADGYLVVAPDTFRGTTTRWLPKALWHTLSTPDERVIEDLDTVVAWLRSRGDVDPERIVVMGFCYGGGKALAYALARPGVPAGTAVFYGDLSDDAAALARLEGPVLGVFGRDDTLVTPAEVDGFERALRRAGVDHALLRFDEVGHAFVTAADGIATDPTQAAAWGAWTAWLREVTTVRADDDER